MNIDKVLDAKNHADSCLQLMKEHAHIVGDFEQAAVLLTTVVYLIDVGLDSLIQTERVNGSEVTFDLER